MRYVLTRDVPPYKKGLEVDELFAKSLNQQVPGAFVAVEVVEIESPVVKEVVEKKEPVAKVVRRKR